MLVSGAMSDKEMAMESIERLPANATLQQIRDRVAFLAAIKEAEDSLDRGEGIPHEQVRGQIATWAKSWHSKSSGRPKRSKTLAK